MGSKKVGILGEKIVENYLKNKRYQILDKNYWQKFLGRSKGEVDIIARKNDTIVFIEVKTAVRDSQIFGGPEQKADFLKQKRLIKLAEKWLWQNKYPAETKWQIDIVAVEINPNSSKAKVRHFENIAGY